MRLARLGQLYLQGLEQEIEPVVDHQGLELLVPVFLQEPVRLEINQSPEEDSNMANGQVYTSVTDSYLQSFNRSIGVSGQQKLQSFPQLQQLGYNGQLGYMKSDFHGL